MLCFKGQLQADSFLVGLIFILLSHISQGDSLVTFEMDYILLFQFKPLQLNHKKLIA